MFQSKVYTTFDPPGSLGTISNVVTSGGTIAGSFVTNTSSGARTGFVDSAGSFTNYNYPGALGTEVVAIGPGGEVVGTWDNTGFANEYSFVIVGGTYYNIAIAGSLNTVVQGINASGTLVGSYQDSSNVWHGFVAVCPTGQSPCTQ
jgi:hypothetical protein